MWRSWIFRCLQISGLTPYILAYVFTLKKDLVQQNSSQNAYYYIFTLMFLTFAFDVETFWICFYCMQINRWKDVSSIILTLLLHRSKWSKTVFIRKFTSGYLAKRWRLVQKNAIYDTLSQIWAFDWRIYIWPWSILKAKVTHVSTVNIS